MELPLAALCFWMASNLARAVEVARPYLQAAGFRIESNRLLPPEEAGPLNAGATIPAAAQPIIDP